MSRAPNDYIYFRRSDSIRLHVKLAVLVLLWWTSLQRVVPYDGGKREQPIQILPLYTTCDTTTTAMAIREWERMRYWSMNTKASETS